MSESTNEILEITDSSINTDFSTIEDHGIKRRLSEDDEEQKSDVKKLCADNEIEKLEESTSSMMKESYIEKDEEKSRVEETDTIICIENTLNASKDKIEELHTSNESECILDELEIEQEESFEQSDEQPSIQMESKNEKFPLESDDSNCINEENSEGESEDDDDEIDDDALMMRVNNSLPLKKEVPKKIENNSEPIALDSDTDEMNEDDDENSEDFHESSQSEEEDVENYECNKGNQRNLHKVSLRTRLLSFNPRFYYARVLVKKSIKYTWKKHSRKELKECSDNKIKENADPQNEETSVDKECTSASIVQLPKENENHINNQMDVSMDKIDIDIEMKNDVNKTTTNEKNGLETSEPISSNELASEVNLNESTNALKENVDETKSSQNHINSQELETHFLLNEIASSSVDDIMNKYVQRSTDQPSTKNQPTLDEFSEELFFCLQQNKIEIQKAQQIWNEKVHLKFKIRELMERIRRHRAVNDIENFGFKPSHDGQQSSSSANALISSKSSTTNSENENLDRSSKLTSESVTRLIQDVKANVLKKEQHRMDFSLAMNTADSYDENSSFGMNPNMQNFGRQGQTIDVQSIINDFRQKNPQEIPRRGRRVKNSFECNFMNESQSQFTKGDKSNNIMKSSSPSGGFPEVSLVPVNNFYKNHSSTLASSSSFGQKSSLLQSILTKQQTTKSPIGYPQSSTLQRLLTAPERSFQSVSRQGQGVVNAVSGHSSKVHNGEITITPIAATSRKQDFPMDDEEENSTDPPLVIDESEDFEINDRTRELICQGCRKNKALFMCAGCSRQWYCSKECQELAWNDHENSCF